MAINPIGLNTTIPPAPENVEKELANKDAESLKASTESARELIAWTMDLLTDLAIPLSAKPILPASIYPYARMEKDVAAFDKWMKQTQSYLGSLHLGLRGCNLIFWSQLLGTKQTILAKARVALETHPPDNRLVATALDKITLAESALEKETQAYLEQKRSWGLRTFRQSLRVTQPYLKELGRVASLTAIAKVASHAFQWTISSLGLLFSGQAFKKALADWKIYKKGTADFETRLRLPISDVPVPPPLNDEVPEPISRPWNPGKAQDWLTKQQNDRKAENLLNQQKIAGVLTQWKDHSTKIWKLLLHKQHNLLENEFDQFITYHCVCSQDELKELKIFLKQDLVSAELDCRNGTCSETIKSTLAKLWIGHERDQQEMRMHAVKNGLLEMVSAKQKMEGAFLKLKLGDTGSIFTISALQFALQVALLVLGLATVPFGGAGVVLFWLGVASFAATTGIFLGSMSYALMRRRHRGSEELQFVNLRLIYATLRKNIAQYRLAKHQLHTHVPKHEDIEFTKMQQKVTKWEDTANALQERLSKASWKDFTEQHLYRWQKWGKPEEVVLQDLSDALKASNPQWLTAESNQLLREYFGITQENFPPDTALLKKHLRHFFTFDHSELIKFMKSQAARTGSSAS